MGINQAISHPGTNPPSAGDIRVREDEIPNGRVCRIRSAANNRDVARVWVDYQDRLHVEMLTDKVDDVVFDGPNRPREVCQGK